MRIIRLNEESKGELIKNLLKRSPNNYGQYENTVNEIIQDVRDRGDLAVIELNRKFDKWDATADTLRVTEAEIDEAYKAVDESFIRVIHRAADNIREFHEKQTRTTWIDMKDDGSILGQRITPIAISGVYMGNQFQTILQLFVLGIDSAMLIIAAQYWGIHDTSSIKKISAMGIRKLSVYPCQ